MHHSLLGFLLFASPAKANDLSWHTTDQSGRTVVYGVPETDEVYARFACDRRGVVNVELPFTRELVTMLSGDAARLTVRMGPTTTSIDGMMRRVADETHDPPHYWAFLTTLPVEHPFLRQLQTAESMASVKGGNALPLRSAGAPTAFRALETACR
jgi:hypothetical protein